MNRWIRRALARAARGRTDGKDPRTERIVQDPVQYALSARRPLEDYQRDRLQTQLHGALYALGHGHATENDMAHLFSAANVTLLLVEQTMGTDASARPMLSDAMAVVKDAQEALLSMQERHERLGRWGAAGQELGHLNTLADLHDQFLLAADQRTVEAAVEAAVTRVRQGYSATTVAQLHSSSANTVEGRRP